MNIFYRLSLSIFNRLSSGRRIAPKRADLYDGNIKPTVSIASVSRVNALIHAGINIASRDTPVLTADSPTTASSRASSPRKSWPDMPRSARGYCGRRAKSEGASNVPVETIQPCGVKFKHDIGDFLHNQFFHP